MTGAWPAPRFDVLGVAVSAITLADALAALERWIRAGQPQYVCVTGAHGIIESRRDPKLRVIHNGAGMVTPDGMPLVWIGRWRGFSNVSRVYGPDLMRAVLTHDRGYRHFLYGGAPGVAERLAASLRERNPSLRLVGVICPPFRPPTPEEDAAAVAAINAAQPDIVWVGLSTPKQEYWMAEHAGRLNAPVLIGVGAAFDFLSGLKAQAPKWMQRSGLEWAFRLATEPRRLWRRYADIVPRLIVLVALDEIGSWFRSRAPRQPRLD
jgi:N-acetylglucosaminyldiphosphoundecaprenol N-acetyl-beta-D-mannosaminyltransferase